MRTSILLALAVFLVASFSANGEAQLSNSVRRETSAEDVHPPKPPHPSTGSSSSSSSSSESSSSESSSESASSTSTSTSTSGLENGSAGSNGVAGGIAGARVNGGPAHKGTLVFLGVAAVAGAAIAAAAVPKRRIETEHPLKGSLNRRINLFSNLASDVVRPKPADDSYVNADSVIV